VNATDELVGVQVGCWHCPQPFLIRVPTIICPDGHRHPHPDRMATAVAVHARQHHQPE
jgi:hypothetical protein